MDVRQRIESIVSSHPVVLFMKGSRSKPQCGFSARVVDVLDELLPEYFTVDVLADEAIREGVKEYGQWPTIPQLYVRGALIGGADIVAEMMRSGELATVLGVDGPIVTEDPEIHVTEGAIAAFQKYSGAAKPDVRLAIDRAFDAELDLEEPREGDLVIDMGTVRIAMDRATARRADGVTIDFVEGPSATGFRVENPAAPPKVKSMSVEQLDRLRRDGRPHLLIDVRTPEERAAAKIEGSELLDADLRAKLEDLERTTMLVLHCHHGVRSRAAAEHCVKMGFRDVWNVEGGIDAWSLRVDSSVPRY